MGQETCQPGSKYGVADPSVAGFCHPASQPGVREACEPRFSASAVDNPEGFGFDVLLMLDDHFLFFSSPSCLSHSSPAPLHVSAGSIVFLFSANEPYPKHTTTQ